MAPTERELYEDWAPLIEWSLPLPLDQELILKEEVYVEQTNSEPGVSAGGPADQGFSRDPLIKKPNPPWWRIDWSSEENRPFENL